jgi:hypothetical protein
MKGERKKEKGESPAEKGEPTPNRVQSSLLELPRCEGGKDHEVGLKEKGERLAQWEVDCKVVKACYRLLRLVRPVLPISPNP